LLQSPSVFSFGRIGQARLIRDMQEVGVAQE